MESVVLVLTEKQVKSLEDFIQELPVKFGVPLLNLIRTFAAENNKKQEEALGSITTPETVVPQEIEAE